MKKQLILGVLFFGTLWGVSEAGLGGMLYGAHVPYASVPLAIIGFILLTVARVHLPQKGTASLIACVAMLYKFLNTPFFVCHFLGIFLLGAAYDLVFSIFPRRNKAICAAAATYLGYALFALLITYVIRYHYWTAEGLPRVLRHIGISGTMAAVGSAILVPLSFRLGQMLKQKLATSFQFRPRLAAGGISAITAALWVLGIGLPLLARI